MSANPGRPGKAETAVACHALIQMSHPSEPGWEESRELPQPQQMHRAVFSLPLCSSTAPAGPVPGRGDSNTKVTPLLLPSPPGCQLQKPFQA